MARVKIRIKRDGALVFIYSDAARPLMELGPSIITRASHVEPEGTQWVADLAPVGGPRFGPYDQREEALSAERDWLNSNLGRLR